MWLSFALLCITLVPSPEGSGLHCHCSDSTYFFLSLELLPLLYLSIDRDLLETTFLISLTLPHTLLVLEGATASSSSPQLSPSSLMLHFFFALLSDACLFSLLLLSFDSALSLALSPSTTHTSRTAAAVVIIKVIPPSCSSLSFLLLLFISLLF